VVIAEKYVKEFEKLIHSIERRVDAEINPGSELLLAKARWAQAVKDLTQARSQKDKSRATLHEVLGRQNIELIYPDITPKQLKSLETFQSDALALSRELVRYKAQIDIAEAEIAQKKSELYPRVFIRQDHTQGNLYGVLPVNQTLLGMEISTGAGLSYMTEIQAALARKEAAQAQSIAAERSITERIQTLWIDTNHNTQQLPNVKQYKDAAVAVAQSYARQFPIGRKSWFEVQNAQREAFTAEVEWSDLRWSTFMLQTQLEVEAGELTPSALFP
jgi:adhesin transport system outer membrane protein